MYLTVFAEERKCLSSLQYKVLHSITQRVVTDSSVAVAENYDQDWNYSQSLHQLIAHRLPANQSNNTAHIFYEIQVKYLSRKTTFPKWTTHNRDRKSLRNHKKSRPTAKGRRVRITKSTLLRSAKYDRWKFMQVNPEDVKLEEWRFRVGYERSPRQVVAGPLNAEGIARDRPTGPSVGSRVLFNIATRRRNWVKVVQSRRWPTEVSAILQ